MSSAGEISGVKKAGRYSRDDLDFFVEPEWCVDLLFDNEPFYGDLWDPACGSCTIQRVGERRGYFVWASDIADRGQHGVFEDGHGRHDFLSDEAYVQSDHNIICNPPFKLADKFIRQALSIARHKVAMLVQAKFLYSQRRHRLFSENPPARIYHLSTRPSMPPGEMLLRGEIKASGGKLDYCWIVWAKDHRGPTQAHWLLRETNGQKAKEEKEPRSDSEHQGSAEAARDHAAA